MASIKLNNYEIFSQSGDAAPKLNNSTGLNFSTTNQNFTIKGIDAPIVGATNSSEDNPNSGQLAIYNGATKLWGINESGWVQTPNVPFARVAFSSYASPNFNYVAKTGGPMPFDTIHEQTGDHYDIVNYRFNCPIDGHYFCSAHTLSSSSSDASYTAIYKNGSLISQRYELYRGFSGSFIIKAYAGDYLQLGFTSNLSYYEGAPHTQGYYYFLG